MNTQDVIVGLVVIGAVLAYLILTHKLNAAAIAAKLSALESSLHDKLNQIIHRNTANDAAPVAAAPAPAPTVILVPAPAPLNPTPAATAPVEPGPAVIPAGFVVDPATAILLNSRAAAGILGGNNAPLNAATPADLWPLPSGLWPIGELQAGQSSTGHYIVPPGWTGTITIAVSGFDTRGHTITIDGAPFDTSPFASPDPRAAEGSHAIVVTAIGLGSGSLNLWHDPR